MLTDKQFSFIQTYLPPKRRPGWNIENFDAIVFVLTTGCQWRRLPKDYGNWHTVYTRFKTLVGERNNAKDGSFLERGIIDCSIIMIDSTVVRAHQCLCEEHRKKGSQGLGRSKGGLTTKIHAVSVNETTVVNFLLSWKLCWLSCRKRTLGIMVPSRNKSCSYG